MKDFPANFIRTRLLIRRFESLCHKSKGNQPTKMTWQPLNDITEASANNPFSISKNPYHKWKRGEAVPAPKVRDAMDDFFPDRNIGSFYGERSTESSEQTILCAFDLISLSSRASKLDSGAEADEIAAAVHSAFRKTVPFKIVRMSDLPRITEYQARVTSKLKNKPETVVHIDRYKHLKEHIWDETTKDIFDLSTRYEPYATFNALMIYASVHRMKQKAKYREKICRVLLLDLISIGIAGYIHMLHRHGRELRNTGALVERYRLIHELYLAPPDRDIEDTKSNIDRYLTNEIPDFLHISDRVATELISLRKTFDEFLEASGLDKGELMSQLAPISPDSIKQIEAWWQVKHLRG